MKDYRIEHTPRRENDVTTYFNGSKFWVSYWSGNLCGWIPSMPCDTREEAENHIAALRAINARFDK